MNKYENYKKNLITTDNYGIKNVNVSKAVSYSGNIGILNKISNGSEDEDSTCQPLAAAVVGINNTAAPFPNDTDFFHTWSDIDTLELFASSKPTCYLILSKPGGGAYSLGEAMSKKFNCIHLCPKNILTDEIEQKSTTGMCINFNMKNNKVITFETLLKMLKIKLESPAVQHRGYVISGFPLVTSSTSPKYLINTLSGEEAIAVTDELLFETIANLKKKKKNPKRSIESLHTSITSDNVLDGVEEEVEEEIEPEELPEEEEDLKVELPKFLLNTCSDIIKPIKAYFNSKKAVLLQQLNDLFCSELKPNIVIHLSSPDKDLVMKKSHKFLNYKNSQLTAEPFIEKSSSEVRWPVKYSTSDYTSPIDSHILKFKYLCRQPINFQNESVEQMCNYKQIIFPFLEKKLKSLDPKYILKLDARLSLHELMHNISERLILMSIKPVIIPEPLFMEEPPDDMEEFWKVVEEINVIHSGVVTFKRSASPWSDRCPVELKKRLSVKGNPKLAVAFSKYVFLFASLTNMITFCRNPRPYLKLKFLEPTCRIIVTGTRLSGKTMISECLSYLFDTPIIHYANFVQTVAQKKYNSYATTILSEIIATIEDIRFAKWQNDDLDRLENLQKWVKSTITSLEEYTPLLKIYLKRKTPKKKTENIDIFEQMLDLEQPEQTEELKHAEGSEQTEEEQREHIEESKHTEQIRASEQTERVDQLRATEKKEMPMEEEEKISLTEFMNIFNIVRSHLSFLPFLDDIDECENARSVQVITQYAPIDLRSPKENPAMPVLGDEDVTKAIAAYIDANDLQKEMEPSVEEIMNSLVSHIISIDTEWQLRTNSDEMYGKYIIDDFPSDPEYWSMLTESKLLPDYTVAVTENREVDSKLIEKYKDIDNHMKNYQERYMLANDPLIKIKRKTKNPPYLNDSDIKMILYDLIQKNTIVEEAEDNSENDPWAKFAEDIEKFKENWDTIKIKLDENNKCFVDVQLENQTDIAVIDEVLLKLRKSYFLPCEISESEELEDQDDETETFKDILTYNNPQNLGETGSYCPYSYYNYGVLWEGKPEFSLKYDNRLYRLCKEENLELIQNDVTKYQSYNKPAKTLPPLRICVIGCIGSGKTTVSKLLAKELGLVHVDFAEFINEFLLPKHFKKVGLQYENSFTDTPIDEEGVVEFQMDEANENLIQDIMSNETELRKMLYNYFERGSQFLPQFMQKVINKIWFHHPFVSTGFVLDGYPRLPTDVEDMVAYYCIPDLVLEVECSMESSLSRISSTMIENWKMQQNEAKLKAKQKFNIEKQEWKDSFYKNIIARLICDEIIDTIFSALKPTALSTESVIIDANPAGSIIDPVLFKAYTEMIQEFPEPVDLTVWEKLDDVRERIESRIETIYENDNDNIENLKELLSEQRIKTASINGNKSQMKVSRLALSKLKDLRKRSESFFEETLIINTDIAEVLLLDGFLFLSKFNRMCPVHIFENPNAIQNTYYICKRKDEVFSIVHRSYVYFVCGEDSVKKFRTNPLKYIKCNNICKFKEYPLRIAVIGAPKSGKSSLCTKLAKRYGLICLSRGIAVRHVLDNKDWTELGSKMKTALSSGECVNSEHIMKAVQSMAMDHRTVTNGFVFDGFPETAPEAMELIRDGLYPNIVFDISTDIERIMENSQNEIYYEILKNNPPYSSLYIENRYKKWQEKCGNVRDWINSDYQNMYVLDGNKSRWQCLQDAVNIINGYIPKVHYYLNNVRSNIVPAYVMGISNEIFEKQMSNFKHICPICLRKNMLRHNMYPIDKQGVVQYKNKFYWVCPDHMNMMLKNPDSYLMTQELDLPEVPGVVKTVCSMALVYEKGVCIVTYAEGLPAQILVVGTNEYSASYKGNRYLFCSKTCLDKFMAKPHLYYDITVFKKAKIFKSLPLKHLPSIGYLEQTLGDLITEACCCVNARRPKYPGLTFQLSGLLHIALYLKTHNTLTEKRALEMYTKASKVFDAKCALLTHVGLYLRSNSNPFAKYPSCCTEVKSEFGSETKTSTVSPSSTSRVPVPDERYDYLVEYHKPASKVPAFLNVVDIAGLVKGAAEGQGLGNAFLSHIKACDAIFNLCRAFDDEDVIHVDGDVNPVRDLETIGEELRLKDEEQLMANFEKLDRVVSRGGDKKLKPEYDALTRIKAVLVDEKKHIRFGDWSAADIEVLNKYLFLTSKPALYLVNLSEKDYIRKKNKWLPKLKEWIDKNDPGAPLIPFSGVLESKLMEMDPEERKAYLKEHNITSALEKIIVQGYKALNLEYFFTAGPDEVKAWTIQKGTKAPQAAGRIHTDFEKGFIMAEVMHYKDFKEEGTEAACKSAGKYRQQGRNYVVEDGDIIFFKFNAGAGLKDAKKK